MTMKRFFRYLLLVAIGCCAIWLYHNNSLQKQQPANETDFNRSLTPIIYTRHAKCRMDCRHIDETEIKDILQNGKINFDKSDPNAKPDPKFALEGISRDNQQLRIIFAPSKRGMVVVTCIDLNQEWECNCR